MSSQIIATTSGLRRRPGCANSLTAEFVLPFIGSGDAMIRWNLSTPPPDEASAAKTLSVLARRR
jgi:hypothetical protein